jgi:hypothetical protein
VGTTLLSFIYDAARLLVSPPGTLNPYITMIGMSPITISPGIASMRWHSPMAS